MPVMGLGVGSGVVAYVLGQALNAVTDLLGLFVGLRVGWIDRRRRPRPRRGS